MTEKRKVRIGRLTTVGQVAAELGRLYRQARRGDVAVGDASRLATILGGYAQCLEASELERRIGEMEAALAVNTRPGSVAALSEGNEMSFEKRLDQIAAALAAKQPARQEILEAPLRCRRRRSGS